MTRLFILLTGFLACLGNATAATYSGTAGSVQFFNEASLHKFDGTAPDFVASFDTDSMTGSLVVQTKTMTTHLFPRDNKMRNMCLEVDTYPTITFRLNGIEGNTDALASGTGSGAVTLKGTLTIRDVTRTVAFAATYNATADSLTMNGAYAFKWTDFNIPDPSIFVSTLYPDMSVQFNVTMKAR